MNSAGILIVEDEAVVAADLASKLGRLGYDVCGIAASGKEAFDLAERLCSPPLAHPWSLWPNLSVPLILFDASAPEPGIFQWPVRNGFSTRGQACSGSHVRSPTMSVLSASCARLV